MASVVDNYQKVQLEVGDAKVVAVSKKQPNEKLQQLLDHSDRNVIIGESYLQEFKEKKGNLRGEYTSHLIGRLQSNKVGDAVRLFDLIESVHSPKLFSLIDKEAKKIGKVQEVFLQVNISNDPDKGGFIESDVIPFIQEEIPKLEGIKLSGLMTITKFYESPEMVRPDYTRMKELYDRVLQECGDIVDLARFELSMGMSSDYMIAVEEGATVVRVGTAIFGERS